MKKFLKKSDKGFSLVELIVVIAIMAVLIGVIAPAFMKYVGKSKDSVKTQNLDEMRRAANIVLADENFEAPSTTVKFTITNGQYAGTNASDASVVSFKKLMDIAVGAKTVTPSAAPGATAAPSTTKGYPQDGRTYSVTIEANGASVTVEAN